MPEEDDESRQEHTDKRHTHSGRQTLPFRLHFESQQVGRQQVETQHATNHPAAGKIESTRHLRRTGEKRPRKKDLQVDIGNPSAEVERHHLPHVFVDLRQRAYHDQQDRRGEERDRQLQRRERP